MKATVMTKGEARSLTLCHYTDHLKLTRLCFAKYRRKSQTALFELLGECRQCDASLYLRSARWSAISRLAETAKNNLDLLGLLMEVARQPTGSGKVASNDKVVTLFSCLQR
jgi:hypothetical protein